MAYKNFKATIWAETIERTLRQKTILTDFCNTNISGQPKYGNVVNILGAGVPSVRKYDPDVGLQTIDKPTGVVTPLLIDQANEFNFMVDNIDRAQATPDLMPALMDEASGELAMYRDKYIASLAGTATNISESLAITTTAEAKKAIDAGIRRLRENNVTPDKNVRIEMPYWMYQLFRDYMVEAKTANDALLKNGTIGMYDGCAVAYSNNIYNDGTDDLIMIRTDKAIALAGQIDKVQPYNPEKFFADAVKGLDVFGAKIVRQNEIYVVKVHEAE